MCTDCYTDLTVLKGGASHCALTNTRTACKQDSADAEWLEHGTDTACMLLGQQFGGGHHGPLIAIECCHKQCRCRYSRLTCTNVALKQTAHGLTFSKVTQNFTDDTPLGICEGKRQCGLKWLVGGKC